MYFDRKDDIHFVKWARQVKIRDRFECQICGQRGVNLHAHHINSWDVHVDQRYDLSNGTTLCNTCHTNFHTAHGYGNNTREQFNEFVAVSEIFMKVLDKKLRVENAIRKIVSNLDGYDSNNKINDTSR